MLQTRRDLWAKKRQELIQLRTVRRRQCRLRTGTRGATTISKKEFVQGKRKVKNGVFQFKGKRGFWRPPKRSCGCGV